MSITKKKRKAFIDTHYCVACGACANACPMGAATVFKGLYAKIDHLNCVGCGKCVTACPASVISLKEVEK